MKNYQYLKNLRNKTKGDQFAINLAYLEGKGIILFSKDIWDGLLSSVELESHTDAGSDMIMALKEPTRECLARYADNFDITGEVLLWWQGGDRGSGVPFSNIKEHYEDLEKWVTRLKTVAKGMPY